jgi:hypothetical protein
LSLFSYWVVVAGGACTSRFLCSLLSIPVWLFRFN